MDKGDQRMKQLRWFNLGMILILLVATFATVKTAQADGTPPPPYDVTLRIKKDVFTSVAASWEWDIAKTASVDSLLLSPGQTYDVGYEVTLSATPLASSNYHIWGTVGIRNNTGVDLNIASITDVLSDGTVVPLVCPYTLPKFLRSGWTLPDCTYNVTLDHSVTSNTVNVSTDIGPFSVTEPVTFGAPTDVVDECVDVFDDQVPGSLGTICAGDPDMTISYTKTVGPFEVCGLYEITNVASFETNDNGADGFAVVTIPVDVPCGEGGCTLTPGYWKTHSSYGPAPYDDTWAQIGEDTAFFFSGQSYYDVLWTNPRGGNAYYILAHAYIAAELNELNGADFSTAQGAFDAATALFSNPTNTPAYVGGLKGSARQTWINLAYVLDRYNNGLLGPMHCSE
jgi:hypothetical protein